MNGIKNYNKLLSEISHKLQCGVKHKEVLSSITVKYYEMLSELSYR